MHGLAVHESPFPLLGGVRIAGGWVANGGQKKLEAILALPVTFIFIK